MPRYFMHVYNAVGFVEDEEGVELGGLELARARVTEGARSIIAEEVMQGRADLRGRIEVCGEAGELLLVLPFTELVEVLLP